MAKCVKCLNNKQLESVITINRDSNKSLFDTLFKNAKAVQLTICKICFGDIAEFLNEEDFIDETPVSWMQDDNEPKEPEVFDCEQEITRYEIVAIPHSSNWHQRQVKEYTKTLTNKQMLKPVETKPNKATRNADNSFTLGQNINDFSNTESGNYVGNECQQFNQLPVKPSAEFKELNNDVSTFIIEDDSNPLKLEHVLETQKENDAISATVSQVISEPEIVCNDISNSNSSTSLNEILRLANEIQHSKKEENIATFEIDDDSDSSSIHFVDELRFEPHQNINEDSIDYIDFKGDIESFQIQVESRAASTAEKSNISKNEIDQNLCSTDEQMRILDEFEKQCEVIELQQTQDKQNANIKIPATETQDYNLQELENSVTCHTFRLNTDSGYSSFEPSFSCSACGQISDKIWKIQEHNTLGDLKSACKDALIVEHKLGHGIICEYCGLFFSRPADLQAHRATGMHADLMYTCPDCFQPFKKFAALNIHSKTHDMPSLKFNTMYMCNVGDCVELCLDWALLSKHKNRCHVAQICPICREEFHDSRFFITHVKSCKEVEINCNFCVKKFHNSCSRTFATHRHDCLSKLEKNFRCDKCESRFKTLQRLSHHKNMRHLPTACGDCGKVFKNKRCVLSHVWLCPKKIQRQNKLVEKIVYS